MSQARKVLGSKRRKKRTLNRGTDAMRNRVQADCNWEERVL